MIDKSDIGKIIKTLRKNNNLTQDELAEKVDISKNYLSKVERGICLLNVETFLKMAEVLDFTLEDFGIQRFTIKDDAKKELVRIILMLSDKEAIAYLKFINLLKSFARDIK